MKRPLLLAATALALISPTLFAQEKPERTASLRDAALTDDLAWDIVEGITTEVGPRLAGSEAEARARDWGVARLTALGFANVRIETFDIPYWERGIATAEITAPFPQPLTITALGNSGATKPQGLTAQVIGFDSLDKLKAADPATVAGKIVFVTHRMAPAQDGSPYGPVGDIRRAGPTIASSKGAAAIMIRSIGTENHRTPHTGATRFADGARPIAAVALSNPDADQLERVLKRGKPVSITLTVTARQAGKRQSGNVIAEIPGRDPAAGIVVVGGHIDSWDLGTGAIDDGAGVAISTAAAKRIMDAGQPLRTIRIVWFGSEEIGLFGGTDYYKRHGREKHQALAESDFGADRIWRFKTTVADNALPAMKPLTDALAPLGIIQGSNGDAEGSDIEDMAAAGAPIIELTQDGTHYFDLHHTPDDTLDKIDLKQLRQNVAAWTAMLSVVANDPVDYGPVPKK